MLLNKLCYRSITRDNKIVLVRRSTTRLGIIFFILIAIAEIYEVRHDFNRLYRSNPE